MAPTTEDQVHELGRRWVEAEQSGDLTVLDAITTDDFTLVGPLGFVLDKQQWLGRYRTGALVTTSLVWDEVTVRDYGGTAVAVGRHTQEATYQDSPVNGRFRVTHIAIRRDSEWLLAGLHLSPIGGPPPFARAGQPGPAA
ncbi:MAG: nuclear transport factor 2 family protein [Pseudonocardiaceae bacterium]